MTKQILILIVSVFLTIAALFTWAVLQPTPKRPSVTLKFSGYTNDANNVRLATFTVRNESQSRVERRELHSFMHDTVPRPAMWVQGSFPDRRSLPPGGTEMLSVVAPTNSGPWRLMIILNENPGFFRDLSYLAKNMLRELGIKAPNPNPLIRSISDPVQE